MNALSEKLEALLFYFGDPVKKKELAAICEASASEVDDALSDLMNNLSSRGITLIVHEDTAQLVTDPAFNELIQQVATEKTNTDLTDAQSEALSVVAYLAPVEKMTIDFVRGVNSRVVLRNLTARGLVQKKSEEASAVYNLTMDAMTHLGISSPEELPDYSTTREQLEEFVSSDPQTTGE